MALAINGTAMVIFNDISAVLGTIQAAKAVGTLVLSGATILVCRDGIFIPWVDMSNMKKRLDLVQQILKNLTEEQKQSIEALRGESDESLDRLEERWAEYSMGYNYLANMHSESGTVKAALRSWTDKDARDLRDKISFLHKDTLASTSIPVREEKRKQKAAAERRARQEADDREIDAVLAAVESNQLGSNLTRSILPTSVLPAIPRATYFIPLRAYFSEIGIPSIWGR